MHWIAIVAPAAASLLTLLITSWHARRMAAAEREAEKNRLLIDMTERRYDDRRDAVIAFDQAAEKATDSIERFEAQHGVAPGDMTDESRLNDLWSAYARVAMLATPPVAEAAATVKNAVMGAFYGEQNPWPTYEGALLEYRVRSRAMLAGNSLSEMDLRSE